MKAKNKAARRREDAASRHLERREVLRRFGSYAAYTAPAMMVLLSSRQGRAGSFIRKGGGRDGGGSLGFSG
ncbi:MAG TPA: hypothetical protein ENJ38_08230 [Rhodospirillales bacterium]|nr:hypothetical protein [Rhodospirillales bacterium]